MNILDNLIAYLNPVAGARRAVSRVALRRLYDAAKSSPRHRIPTDRRSGDGLVDHATWRPMAWARHLEQNVDLISGLLDTLSAQAAAVQIEPQVKTTSGELADDVNEALAKAWTDHRDALEVTGGYAWEELAQLIARSWLRDGEVFIHHLERAPVVGTYHTRVPYQIQVLEADYLPYDLTARRPAGGQLRHGVEQDRLGRPLAYHVYKEHPGDTLAGFQLTSTTSDLLRLDADHVSHLRLVKRIPQTRGISALAPVIRRVDDLKDYEESERVAARLAASVCAVITRNSALAPSTTVNSDTDAREWEMQAGMIFDSMLPGEGVEMINPTRPNPNVAEWRATQLRAIAAGAGASYSTLARDYSGTYSSQRQELVEQVFAVRRRLQAPMIASVYRPVWRRFARQAALERVVSTRGIDPETLTDATFSGLSIPWIDPLKETQAEREAVDAGFKSRPQVIREHGGDPREVDAAREMDDAAPEPPAPVAPPAEEVDDADAA